MGTRTLTSDRGVSRLLADLQSLLEDKSGDTVFLIGPKEIPIRFHSFILRNRCKSFRPEPIHYPDVSPELFRTFLTYVYTGKLSVEESSIFNLFCLAGDFGMEDLVKTCEDLLWAQMDGRMALQILNAGMTRVNKAVNSGSVKSGLSQQQQQQLQQVPKGLSEMMEKCITFVGENPGECLQSPTFLTLPMETLVKVVSSDQLCLEEEQVWRSVLRWAQFQAGVETHVTGWTEEERGKVAKYLSPVISHVRLLLIDSQLFAEEIEPTGCVPMALSLERYRFAALPHHHQGDELTPRLTPRNPPRLFQSSAIIQHSSLGLKLNEWFGSKQQSWRCAFRASTHGFSAHAFHNHCDGLAPTIVVAGVKDTNWICGGFADVPWTSSKTPRYATSSKAFLFCYDGNETPLKFSIVKKHFALCHDANSGPIFGAGADLSIASNCNDNADSYSNLPHSYESDGGDAVLTPTYTFTISDYEVFVPI